MFHSAVLLSIPGLREKDLSHMPNLARLGQGGALLPLTASFPCVTCPVQVNLTTGQLPEKHGVIANGFYWRDKAEVEMWTAWNSAIQSPQIWQILKTFDPTITSAVWFPLLSKGALADWICTPAPIHNPDGSESLWCYTKPTEMYGELRDALGHFPLMNFWGPLANIKSTDWIVDSAVWAAKRNQPRFSYIYLPHLDYAAQKFGPDSSQATQALTDLDAAVGRLVSGYHAAGMENTLWLAASEYVITQVSQPSFPNRILRDAGYLDIQIRDGLEHLVPESSRAWALVDHQLAHVFVRDSTDIPQVLSLLKEQPGIAKALAGPDRSQLGLNHSRSGDIVLLSQPESWFAYYWWNDDTKAPPFARTVDIHRKPGYDPVELFIDPPTRSIPLNASLVQGSHGYPADSPSSRGVLVSSSTQPIAPELRSGLRDIDVASIVLRNFRPDFTSRPSSSNWA